MAVRTPPLVPGVPLVGNAPAFRRDPIELLRRGLDTFGPIFSIRLGPRRAAVIIGPEHQQFFFGETDRALTMPEVYRAFVPIFGEGFTLAAEPGEYREQRAILQPAFAPQRLGGYIEVFVRETDAWLDGLGSEGELELVDAIEKLSLEMIAAALMGDDFRRLMGADFWQLYRDVVRGLDFVLPPFLPLPRFRRRDRARRLLHKRIGTIIGDRRADPGGHDDFLQALAEAHYSDGREVPVSTLQSMILFLVFSAAESTPLQASWTLILLLQQPDYLASVVEENGPLLAANAGPTGPDVVRRMHRLHWAILETERMRPMITMLWRYNREAYDLGGYHVPQGWSTVICPPLAHRLPHVFADPDRYDPERFSPGRAEHRQAVLNLVSFGGGAHHCPGMAFARSLTTVMLSRLVDRFELRLSGSAPGADFSNSITRPGRCLVRYRRRTRPRGPRVAEPAVTQVTQ
jgi:sterol 14-demethylase